MLRRPFQGRSIKCMYACMHVIPYPSVNLQNSRIDCDNAIWRYVRVDFLWQRLSVSLTNKYHIEDK